MTDRDMSSLFSLHIRNAARRVSDTHRLRQNDAAYAHAVWERHETLSAAIQRDDAKKALLDLSDANTLALAILRLDEAFPDAYSLAEAFHEEYERLAPELGYRTREESAVPWDDVPATNKNLMVATARAVLARLRFDAEFVPACDTEGS